jgi:hypothetical protein
MNISFGIRPALAMCCDVKYGEEDVEEYDEDREPFIQNAGFHKDSALHLTGDGDSASLVRWNN